MRRNTFLRTPVRGDMQSRLRNVTVTEVPPEGDPKPGDSFPQTLELSFDTDTPGLAVEIAPLWEGALQFIPDTIARNPTVPAEVVESRYDKWSVTGDLLLKTPASVHEDAFRQHLPGFDPVPHLVRYSKVVLTKEFLFTTLATVPQRRFTLGGVSVAEDDPFYHRKLVISILSGTGRIWVTVDPADPAKDTAALPMPVVAPPSSAGTAQLRLTVASTSFEVLSPTWFDQRPAYDDLPGEQLVPPALRTLTDQLSNPAHPAHSVISAWALFQAAPDLAYAPDHAAAPVRAALAAPRPDGRRYRRIELRRPPLPGSDPSAAPRRPYPAHQLCWRPSAGGPTESLRLPLSGVVHLPLADDTYRFWVIPRSADPSAMLAGDQVQLSLPPTPPRLVGAPPQTSVDVALGAGPSATIDTHLRAYDAAMVWEGYRAVAPRQTELQDKASAHWNVDAHLAWIVPRATRNRPQSALYALFRESAGRHGLSPEFLQVVFFGEGGANELPASGAFNPNEVLQAYDFVGLDLIVYRTGRLPVGRPPIPPEVPAGAVDERAEYLFNLVTAGYVDSAVAAAVNWDRTEVRTEAGFTRSLEVGTVNGWAAAIELVAAELHARLDEMTAYLAGKVPPVAVPDELSRRFLTYARFNSRPSTARTLADNLAVRLRPWVGAPPPDNTNVHFNTIQRLAVVEWHDAAAAYREA
ncbi:hypothetical protein [Micromonospora sp. DPT]|uniref:hypothetical protein n=1 Tax=Micromonospora sp. DPT TaxID=3142975 RepID=UPI00320A3239